MRQSGRNEDDERMLNYVASGASDIGHRRLNNEDAFLVRPELGLMAVADGMGGAAAGELASAIFIEAAGELFGSVRPASVDHASFLVQEVFRVANERMIAHVAAQQDHQGMGCTAELLAFCGEHYVLGHVGDSRTYLYRGGELRQITKDHSLVQQQLDRGLISSAEAKRHSMKNVVLRALGANIALSLDLVRGRVLPGDLFLLCSDGLTDMLGDQAVAGHLASRGGLADQVALLIEEAKSAGGRDNVTVVLCQAG